MFNQYPRLVLKEKKVVFSKAQLIEEINKASKTGKQCEMSLYAFGELKNNIPNIDSAIIDCILWEGSIEFCEQKMIGKKPSILLSDGDKAMLILFKNSTKEELISLGANTNLGKMIVIPGYVDLRTGRTWKIVKKNE